MNTKLREQISEGVKRQFPLQFSLNSNNSKNFGNVKMRELRNSCWVGKWLIVKVNEEGKC